LHCINGHSSHSQVLRFPARHSVRNSLGYGDTGNVQTRKFDCTPVSGRVKLLSRK